MKDPACCCLKVRALVGVPLAQAAFYTSKFSNSEEQPQADYLLWEEASKKNPEQRFPVAHWTLVVTYG